MERGGGLSHIDTYDMKPDAPSEYRGDFRPIRTKGPGIEVSVGPMAQRTVHGSRFMLTELLVVITIIAILASMLIVPSMNANGVAPLRQ